MSFVRTFKRRKLFLDQLEMGASVSFAASAADGSVSAFKNWRNADPNFASDWDEAIEAGTDFLEDAAMQRGLRKSDALAMFFLKARRPDKYDRGSKLELSGGINVEGSKAKLLNKIARLQAQRGVLPGSGEEEPKVLGDFSQAEEGLESPPVQHQPDPSSIPGRGSKRRAVEGSSRKQAAG